MPEATATTAAPATPPMTVLDRALAEPPFDPTPVPFGKPMRDAHFLFAPSYHNLNHGAYGTYPRPVAAVRDHHLREHEARPDLYKQRAHAALVARSRAALLPVLGSGPGPEDGPVALDEIVLVANATTGVNVVVQNLAARWSAAAGDAVFFFDHIYDACRKTLLALEQVGRLRAVAVAGGTYPLDDNDDDAIVAALEAAHATAVAQGLRPRMAVFDTVSSMPGVRMPWERLAAACRRLGILSLVDAAHSIGQIDLTHLAAPLAAGGVQPDFFVANCHKWLFVPRGCAVLYVPRRHQHHIETSLPTSHGYLLPDRRDPAAGAGPANSGAPPRSSGAGRPSYFADLFVDVATYDYSPWMAIPAAVAFRRDVCGGEDAIRHYCFGLARQGGERVATVLGTEVMDNPRSGLRACAMAMVRLPVDVRPDEACGTDADRGVVPVSRVGAVLAWLLDRNEECDTFIRVAYYGGHLWARLSAQIYLDMDDFEWCAHTLAALCARINKGEWREKA